MMEIVTELERTPELLLERNTVQDTVNQAQSRRVIALMVEFFSHYLNILRHHSTGF